MTKKVIKQLVDLCNYPELQKLWKPKLGDEYWWNPGKVSFVDARYVYYNKPDGTTLYPGIHIWLPRIEDCIKILGSAIILFSLKSSWRDSDILMWRCPDGEWDKSPRLACLKALRSVLEGT